MSFLFVLFIKTLVFIHYSLHKKMALSKSIDRQYEMSLTCSESYHYYQHLWAHHKSAFQHKLSSVVVVRAIVNNMSSYILEIPRVQRFPPRNKEERSAQFFYYTTNIQQLSQIGKAIQLLSLSSIILICKYWYLCQRIIMKFR